VDGVGILLVVRHIDLGHKAVDGNGTVLDSTLAEEAVEDLTPVIPRIGLH
jgi:hypothetical protein